MEDNVFVESFLPLGRALVFIHMFVDYFDEKGKRWSSTKRERDNSA